MTDDKSNQLADAALLRELQIGIDQADAGDVADWDFEEMLAEAYRRREGLLQNDRL